jgi:hypothetical protein
VRREARLRRHGYLDETPLEARSNELPEQAALDACAAIALGRGHVTIMPRDSTKGDDGHGAGEEATDKPALVVDRDGCKTRGNKR